MHEDGHQVGLFEYLVRNNALVNKCNWIHRRRRLGNAGKAWVARNLIKMKKANRVKDK